MEKCKYYNNSRTAVSLMIDDLSLTATTIDGTVKPDNDWGYALNKKNSLYNYLENNLLVKYPEIKGTVFFPIHKHAAQNIHAGYNVLFGEFNDEFKDFIKHISKYFDFAFHGTTHGKFIDEENPSFKNWQNEFEYLTLNDIQYLKHEISKTEELLRIKFTGGKYPGYVKNSSSVEIIEALGMKWWCSDYNMMNKIHKNNKPKYIGKQNKIIELPTNLAGNIFNKKLRYNKFWKYVLSENITRYKKEHFIQYLYNKGLPITIQEHHYCLRTDGKRQTPNIFDDINSLDKIYGMLRGADTWYASCNELAHYIESYDHTEITRLNNGDFEIKYSGNWHSPIISVKSKCKIIKNVKSNEILQGIYKQGDWIFNNLPIGKYRELH